MADNINCSSAHVYAGAAMTVKGKTKTNNQISPTTCTHSQQKRKYNTLPVNEVGTPDRQLPSHCAVKQTYTTQQGQCWIWVQYESVCRVLGMTQYLAWYVSFRVNKAAAHLMRVCIRIGTVIVIEKLK